MPRAISFAGAAHPKVVSYLDVLECRVTCGRDVAIVGAGTIRPRIVAHNGTPAVRRTLPLSLTFDHRVATGADAARFLKAMIESLEGKATP